MLRTSNVRACVQRISIQAPSIQVGQKWLVLLSKLRSMVSRRVDVGDAAKNMTLEGKAPACLPKQQCMKQYEFSFPYILNIMLVSRTSE